MFNDPTLKSGANLGFLTVGADPGAPFGSGGYFEMEFKPGVGDQGAVDIIMKEISPEDHRELWIRQWIWYDEHWTMDHGSPSSHGMKTILLIEGQGSSHTGSRRNDLIITEDSWTLTHFGTSGGWGAYPNPFSSHTNRLFNGQWHYLDYHVDWGVPGQQSVVLELWVDGVAVHRMDQNDRVSDYPADSWIRKVELCRLLNDAGTGSIQFNQRIRYGQTEMWFATDKGGNGAPAWWTNYPASEKFPS